jgi:hypothetical protein
MASDEALTLLRSIDASLKQLVRQTQQAAPKLVADDADLDSKYGDPELKFTPRDWQGDSYKGRKFSECPAALLDLVADSLDYFARKSEEAGELTSGGKPVAPYKRKDAARARGWAARVRAGKVPQAVGASGDGDFITDDAWPTDDDL